jgi:hypothetical protein
MKFANVYEPDLDDVVQCGCKCHDDDGMYSVGGLIGDIEDLEAKRDERTR